MKKWLHVRRDLGNVPLVEGVIGATRSGTSALYAEHYLFSDIERTVSSMPGTGLVTQFGGARVREGESGAWRSTSLPRQSLLVPANCPTHWHYSGTVDFAVFYFPDHLEGVAKRLVQLASKKGQPILFSDALVSALAQQLVRELHKGRGGDERFMTMLVPVMLEQAYRVLTTPETSGFNPRHIHLSLIHI